MVRKETPRHRHQRMNAVLKLEDDMPWQQKAYCRRPEVQRDFPIGSFENCVTLGEAQALAILTCGNCPVMSNCANWAKWDDYDGVAGGKLWKGTMIGINLLPKPPKITQKTEKTEES